MPFTSANLQRKKFLKIATGIVNFCIAVSLILDSFNGLLQNLGRVSNIITTCRVSPMKTQGNSCRPIKQGMKSNNRPCNTFFSFSIIHYIFISLTISTFCNDSVIFPARYTSGAIG